MKKIFFLLIVILTTSLIFVSCNKDEKDEIIAQSDTSTVGASATIDAANALDLQTGIEINTDETVVMKTSAATSTCAVVTVDNDDTYPKVFTVDYGDGCTINSITRKGKLKITVSDDILTTGSKMTIERMDYSINGMKLEGTIDYVNTTTDPQVPQWTRTVKNGKFTNANGKVFLNAGSYTMQQTAGVDTPLVLADNVYEMIQGSHTITNETGNTLTLTVQETLVKKYSCEYISKGKLKVEGILLDGVIDYGNNNCDNNYTYTHKNGIVYELKM